LSRGEEKSEREFKINDYLTLKLIEAQTVIYVDDKPFHQCKYLLLNLSSKDFAQFEQIDSIDDAFAIYKKMASIPPVKRCSVWPSWSLFSIAEIRVIELRNFLSFQSFGF